MSSNLTEIRDDEVDIETEDGETKTVENDSVFTMIGREPPLEFFRKSGVHIRGEKNFTWWWTLIAFMIACFWLYHWKDPSKTLFSGGGLGVAGDGWRCTPRTGCRRCRGGWASGPRA